MRLIPEKDFKELQRHPESGVWYVRKYVNGKERLQSTKERTNKIRAKNAALRILSEWYGKPVRGYEPTFAEQGQDYIDLKRPKSKATLDSAMNSVLLHLNPFFGHMKIGDIKESTFEDFVAQERTANPDRRLFNDWKHFIGIMNRARRRGLIEKVPEVSNPDTKKSTGKVFTKQEEFRLIRAAKYKGGGHKYRLQMLLGIKMGMRIGEILALNVEKVDLKHGFIKLGDMDTKTRYARIIPIHPRVKPLLIKRLNKIKGTALFPAPGKPNKPVSRRGNKTAWQNIKARAGVTGRFHDLRHTCATRTAEANMNPVIAARILGMSLEVYDKVYCKPKPDALMRAMREFARFGF